MIQVNELRVGNLFNYGNEHVKVTAIFKTHFICEKLDGIVIGNSLQNRFQPIPLTPELLEKCGFESKDGYLSKYPLYSVREHSKGELICIGSPRHSGNICCSNFQYLHQLQNLYFCLTSIELTISEQAPETSVASKDAQGTEPRLPNSLPISQVKELIRHCAENEFYYDGGKLRGNAPYSAPSTTEEEILTNFLNQLKDK